MTYTQFQMAFTDTAEMLTTLAGFLAEDEDGTISRSRRGFDFVIQPNARQRTGETTTDPETGADVPVYRDAEGVYVTIASKTGQDELAASAAAHRPEDGVELTVFAGSGDESGTV